MEAKEAEETYPTVPNPVTVEAKEVLRNPLETKFNKLGAETKPAVRKASVVELREVSKKDVLTKFNKLGAETKPAVWKNRVVEAREALETYPTVPNPITVEVRFG